MARSRINSRINSGVADDCFFGALLMIASSVGVLAFEIFQAWLWNEHSISPFDDYWVIVSVKPKGLCNSAKGVLDRALYHSFTLVRLNLPSRTAEQKPTRTTHQSSREKDERKMSIWRR
jgi:hypothetical protein